MERSTTSNTEEKGRNYPLIFMIIFVCCVFVGIVIYAIYTYISGKKPDNVKKWKIRYLKIARTNGLHMFVNVERMALYSDGRFIPAVNGIVSPPFPDPAVDFGWQRASKELTVIDHNKDITHTAASPDAFIEFDFGSEHEVDRVQLLQRQVTTGWNGYRSMGLTFTASDGNKKPVIAYQLDEPFIFEANFEFPNVKPKLRFPETVHKWKVRYLKLTRTDGQNQPLNIERMAIYNYGKFITPVNGTVSPPFANPDFGSWQSASKELAVTDHNKDIAHTAESPNAVIEFDFGKEHEVDRIQLIQRQVLIDWNGPRTTGSTFTAYDGNKNIVLTYQITQPFTFQLNFYPPEPDIARGVRVASIAPSFV